MTVHGGLVGREAVEAGEIHEAAEKDVHIGRTRDPRDQVILAGGEAERVIDRDPLRR